MTLKHAKNHESQSTSNIIQKLKKIMINFDEEIESSFIIEKPVSTISLPHYPLPNYPPKPLPQQLWPIHVYDTRDKVFLAIVKALVILENRPSSPKELASCIIRHRLALLGGATPFATVSSRISQHFKRVSELTPERSPLLGKQFEANRARKIRYFIDIDASNASESLYSNQTSINKNKELKIKNKKDSSNKSLKRLRNPDSPPSVLSLQRSLRTSGGKTSASLSKNLSFSKKLSRFNDISSANFDESSSFYVTETDDKIKDYLITSKSPIKKKLKIPTISYTDADEDEYKKLEYDSQAEDTELEDKFYVKKNRNDVDPIKQDDDEDFHKAMMQESFEPSPLLVPNLCISKNKEKLNIALDTKRKNSFDNIFLLPSTQFSGFYSNFSNLVESDSVINFPPIKSSLDNNIDKPSDNKDHINKQVLEDVLEEVNSPKFENLNEHPALTLLSLSTTPSSPSSPDFLKQKKSLTFCNNDEACKSLESKKVDEQTMIFKENTTLKLINKYLNPIDPIIYPNHFKEVSDIDHKSGCNNDILVKSITSTVDIIMSLLDGFLVYISAFDPSNLSEEEQLYSLNNQNNVLSSKNLTSNDLMDEKNDLTLPPKFLVRRVDNDWVNATLLLRAGKVETNAEINMILAMEPFKVKLNKGPDSLMTGIWIPLDRAKELAQTCSIIHKLIQFCDHNLHTHFQFPLSQIHSDSVYKFVDNRVLPRLIMLNILKSYETSDTSTLVNSSCEKIDSSENQILTQHSSPQAPINKAKSASNQVIIAKSITFEKAPSFEPVKVEKETMCFRFNKKSGMPGHLKCTCKKENKLSYKIKTAKKQTQKEKECTLKSDCKSKCK